MDKTKKTPSFLKALTHGSNGRVRESHSPRSVLYFECNSAECQDEDGRPQTREYQIASFDARSGTSVFRCVNCDNRVKI